MGGGPLFFALLMPLIGWRLGQNYTITQKSAVSVIVSEFCVIVYEFPCLYGVSPVCRKMLLKFGDIVIFCQGVSFPGRYRHGKLTKPVNTALLALHRF